MIVLEHSMMGEVAFTAWKNMYGMNVDVVNNQSHNSKRNLLFADWLFTTTTLDLYIFFRAVVITPPCDDPYVLAMSPPHW